MSELRDQHKAFAEWFLQQNPIAPNVEDMAWAAWKAALAQPESDPPRDEWRLASEPPDNQRTVILWCKRTRRCYTGWHDGHIWHSLAPDITHWRDVTPPTTEGE